MKRSQFMFTSKNKLSRAKSLLENQYPDLKLTTVNDKIDSNGCKHVLFIDSVDSARTDVNISSIIEKLGGKLVSATPITL